MYLSRLLDMSQLKPHRSLTISFVRPFLNHFQITLATFQCPSNPAIVSFLYEHISPNLVSPAKSCPEVQPDYQLGALAIFHD